MSKDDTRETFVPDPTATHDSGGAVGAADAMAGADSGPINDTGDASRVARTGDAAAEQGRIGALPDTASDPDQGVSVPTGAAGSQDSGDHPMSHTNADDVSTARTDHRDDAQNPDRGLGNEWTGETAADQEFRDNPPTRRSGEEQDTAANDAF